jgi:DNA-binding NarL/FixJ family response regulator
MRTGRVPQTAGAKGTTMSRARILLADDHQEIRDLVIKMLEPEFAIVRAVADGQALLEAASALSPDVCLLDISMPIISGIEAANQLKESGSTAKIIMLTVHEDPDFVRAALNSGASGYVLKSRMGTDLPLAVKRVLAGKTFLSESLNHSHSTHLKKAR